MLPLITLSILTLASAQSHVKSLGAPDFACDPKVMAPSATKPTSVNQVRFADIKVIAALGDSLTAANGAGAPRDDPLQIVLQFRGLCFHGGGQTNLSDQITVPNILKKFNPDVFGYAVDTGSENVWEVARLNGGIPGAQSHSFHEQARSLVNKIKSHPDVKADDWKLVNLFIGSNDVCRYCHNFTDDQGNNIYSSQHYYDHIVETVQILKDNLPNTIVSMTGMFNMGMVRKVDKNELFCDTLHIFECQCEKNENFTDPEIDGVCQDYMREQQKIQDSGMFEANDFTFVIQPFFEDVHIPPMANGKVDLTFFAPDCFHFSKYGHAMVAKNLWNSMVAPVGQKLRQANFSDWSPTLECPSMSCPFFPTVKNSQNCAKLWTPSVLD